MFPGESSGISFGWWAKPSASIPNLISPEPFMLVGSNPTDVSENLTGKNSSKFVFFVLLLFKGTNLAVDLFMPNDADR